MREKNSAGPRLAEQVEQHGRHAALAVVVVGLDPRVVVAVGDGTLVDVEPQQPALRAIARPTTGSFTPACCASTRAIVNGTPGEFIMP
jgi:hypothetical protein